jgi:hypothetical protein
MGGAGNHEREQPGQHIAQAGNQSEDPVQAEANAGAGDDESLVQQNLQDRQGVRLRKIQARRFERSAGWNGSISSFSSLEKRNGRWWAER